MSPHEKSFLEGCLCTLEAAIEWHREQAKASLPLSGGISHNVSAGYFMRKADDVRKQLEKIDG